jgi:hypothetical protein
VATYEYFAFDLRSGDVLGDLLDVSGARPKWSLNDPGDLGDVTVPLGDLDAVQRADVRGMTVPWRHGIVMTREGVAIKAACVTSRRYISSPPSYRLSTTGILGFWRRRAIATNITWKAVEQFEMVRQLLVLGAFTIPLDMPGLNSGIIRDRTLAGSDLKMVLDAILELADNLDGFDIAIDTAFDAAALGAPKVRHTLLLGYPRLGRTDTGSGLMTLEWPHTTVGGYEWGEDGSEHATHVFGSSQTDSGVNLVRRVFNVGLLDAGWVRTDLALTFSGISNTTTLDNHLLQALAEAAGFSNAPAFTVPDDGETAAGSWAVGDDVRVRITDPYRFPTVGPEPGMDVVLRLQEATLDPANGQTTMTMAPITVPVT